MCFIIIYYVSEIKPKIKESSKALTCLNSSIAWCANGYVLS